jgi:hexokinase
MLPSYSHQLPFGSESGQYLALDVGGSTLRVAVVELRGRGVEADKQSEIISMHNYRIGKDIKDLEGMDFFNWMGQKIAETLAESGKHDNSPEKPLPVACAWSFPIE